MRDRKISKHTLANDIVQLLGAVDIYWAKENEDEILRICMSLDLEFDYDDFSVKRLDSESDLFEEDDFE